MALTLNHFTIRTTDLEATRRFYADVLGLTVGPRPAFPFPGLWMYRGDHADVANAVVHVIHLDGSDTKRLKAYLGDKEEAASGTGAVDHIAFFADGLAAMLAHFAKHHVKFEERTVPAIGLHQLFLHDPSGVKIELNYPAAEQAARLASETKAAV
jgi:catechol 2,3-dioxygenase-like lactoylglutathione lyase family enzyme